MKVSKSIFSIILFFIISNIFSQENIRTVYLDEKLNGINLSEYNKKCNSYIFKCLEYKTDSIVLNKVMHRYFFGQLSKNELKQIKYVLKRDSSTKLEPNNSIIIKFRDTIYDFNSIYDNHKKFESEIIYNNHKKFESEIKNINQLSYSKALHLFQSNYKRKHKSEIRSYSKRENKSEIKSFSKRKHRSEIKSWKKSKTKCIKKFKKKYPVDIFYIFKHDKGGLKDYEGFNWIKDNNVFKHRFFKIIYNYNLLIIKPNGNYFLSGGHFSYKNLKKIINEDDWNVFLEDYKITKEKYPKSGYGIFKKPNFRYHIPHCF